MHKFHYKYITKRSNTNLLLTDTASLVYEIKTNEVYENFYKNKTLFHFSDYPQDSKFFHHVNKKLIGICL